MPIVCGVTEVPRAVRAGCALNEWLGGRLDADAAIAQVGHACSTIGFVLDTEVLTSALMLRELRRRGTTRVTVSLPVPGDLQGLGGPARFNVLALEAGEALVLHGCDLGIVPEQGPDGVVWHVIPAQPPSYVPDVDAAARDLRQALLGTTEELAALGVASWSPDAADALLDLRAPRRDRLDVAVGSPEAAALLLSALRCRQVVALALRDDGGAVTGGEADQRRRALTRLNAAARAALVAVGSSTGFLDNPADGLAAR